MKFLLKFPLLAVAGPVLLPLSFILGENGGGEELMTWLFDWE
jgi:hypothetical protein